MVAQIILQRLKQRLSQWLNPDKSSASLETDDDPPLSKNQKTLVSNILNIPKRTVSECMIPRADMASIPLSLSFEETIQRFATLKYSRLPVYGQTPDDIVGLVHIKDIFVAMAENERPLLEDILRPIYPAAPSMLVLDLLLHMQQSSIHMALIIDEFGGSDGLVTIEDLLEQITGAIHDEHDVTDQPSLTQEENGTCTADSRVSIATLENVLGVSVIEDSLEDKNIDTLGGLIFFLANRVPEKGEILKHPSHPIEFEILQADPRRIHSVRIRRLPSDLADDQA